MKQGVCLGAGYATRYILTKPVIGRRWASIASGKTVHASRAAAGTPSLGHQSLEYKKAEKVARLSGVPVEMVTDGKYRSLTWNNAADPISSTVKPEIALRRDSVVGPLSKQVVTAVRTTPETDQLDSDLEARLEAVIRAESKVYQKHRRDLQFVRSILVAHHEPILEMIRPDVLLSPFDSEGGHTVFLAIDTEFRGPQVVELGFAALDTAVLESGAPGRRGTEWFKFIQASRYYLTGSPLRKKSGLFLFGQTQMVEPTDLSKHIGRLFDKWYRAGRRVVLVGHSLHVDMVKIRFTLDDSIARFPNIAGVVDTSIMTQQVNGASGTLKELYHRLSNSRGQSFHNAGNDAVYTLRALLMLATTPSNQWAMSKRKRVRLDRSNVAWISDRFWGKRSRRTDHSDGWLPHRQRSRRIERMNTKSLMGLWQSWYHGIARWLKSKLV